MSLLHEAEKAKVKFLKIPRSGYPGRRIAGLVLISGAILGGAFLSTSACGGSNSADVVEVPAGASAGPSSLSFELSTNDRDEITAAAMAMAPTGVSAEVKAILPSYERDGAVKNVVVELSFPSFSGNIELPNKRILEADGERYGQKFNVMLGVRGLRGLYVNVDLNSKDVIWATPVFPEVGSKDIIVSHNITFESSVDTQGRQIPDDALRAIPDH